MDSGKKRYKVVYYRSDCIGAGACATAYPERWAMNEDNSLADLKGGKKVSDNPETWELEFTDEELERFKDSSFVCPAEVIKIIDLETGKEVK